MLNCNRFAKINVKVLVVLIIVTVALVTSLFTAHHVRRSLLSKMYLKAGQAAFENRDWPAAYKNFQEYLSRNPDDLEITKQYAEARLSVRPLDRDVISAAISAYRRVIQLDPLDEIAYGKLAMLYGDIDNYGELAYIARTRLEHVPNDREAPLWLADALVQLNRTDEASRELMKLIGDIEALADKHVEYVRACLRMSNIAGSDGSSEAVIQALEWLNRAVDYNPESVEALANRARFYRETHAIPGISSGDQLASARKDLEAADNLGTQDPRVRLILGSEWLAQGELDLAEAEIQAIENLPQETLEEYFFDVKVWTTAKYLFVSELAARRGAIMEAASLTDEVLTELTEQRHRMQVLPSAIGIYVTANKTQEARNCLDEYLDGLHNLEETQESTLQSAYLQALVAMAEERPYVVIDILQQVVVNNVSVPELWRLIAEAYSRTDQARRAINALIKYLSFYPRDPRMNLQLAREYYAIKDWERTFETSKLAESLNPTDIIVKLLRIEAGIHVAAERIEGIDTARLEELSTELTELRREDPNRVDIRILQASLAMYLEQIEEAERELKLAIEQCDEPLRAEMQLANYYHETGRTAEAIGVCRLACERHFEVAEPWQGLSELYIADENYDSARSCLKQGLETVTTKQQKRSLSIGLALLELLYGDRTTGIDILSELAEQDEQEIRARLLLLGIREIQEDLATAERLIDELQLIEGQTGLWWRMHRASLLLSSNEWRTKQQDIIDLLQYCIDSDPQWSSPVLLLTDMYEKLNDFRRLEDICQQALVRNPSASDVADRLLLLLEEQGRFADADKILQQVETNWQITSAWQIRMALRAGDLSRAINELKLRVSNDDRDAASRIQLARLVYLQLKDASEALAYLKEAEEIISGSLAITATKASILKAEGQTEEALQIIDYYVANKNDFNAYWMRALYLALEGEFERAEDNYRKLTTFTEAGATGYSLLSNFYIDNDRRDKAITTLEEGLNVYPSDLTLKRALMKLLFLRGFEPDRIKAMEILTTLEEQLPEDTELMKMRAAVILEEKTPQSRRSAAEKLEYAIQLEPTEVDVHLMLIDLAMRDGDYQTARDSAIRALGSNPDNLELMSARGIAELALGQTQLAVELSRMVLRQDPDNAGALNIALQSNDHSLLEEARMLIESALDADPADEQLLLSRARVLVSLGLAQDAIPELETYCQTDEGINSADVILTLADLYRLSGDMDRAKQRIEQAERIDPNSLNVVHARFLWLVAQKRFGELAQISSAYLSAKRQNPATLVAAASILTALDSVELAKEGLKLFEHAATLSPRLLEAQLGLASCLYQTGNAARAAQVYQELLEQYPNNIQALNDLAWILQEHENRYDDALDLVNRGLTLAPDDLYMLDTRGTILSRLEGRLSDARGDFERLIEIAPSGTEQKAEALLKLGRICVELGDFVKARQHLQEALEIDRKIDVFSTDERSEIEMILQGSEI